MDPDIRLRPATADDFDFLFRLHEEAMRGLVEEVFGFWDAVWQRDYFRQYLDLPNLRVIQVGQVDAGMLVIQERSEEIFLVDLEILPAYQRRGVGSAVIRGVLGEAARRGKPVALQVLKANIRARSLYQRLGFGVTGENETHYIMAYEPR